MSNSPTVVPASKETGRVEAFSDGVFAIALTLLVLNLQVPHDLPPGGGLGAALLRQWPVYVAYVASFATIGIMWINHHYLFNVIRRVDHWMLVFNTLLLLGITVVPFPTALLAEYFGHPEARTAALVYGGVFVVIAILFNVLWRYASRGRRLLTEETRPETARAIDHAYAVGVVLYLVAFLLAFLSVTATLLTVVGLAIYFALPRRSLEPRSAR